MTVLEIYLEILTNFFEILYPPLIVYQNKLDKTCFWHDMVYEDFNGFPVRGTSDNVLRDKVFNIVKKSKR